MTKLARRALIAPVLLALAGAGAALAPNPPEAPGAGGEVKGEPYTLRACPVSGKPLGSMGEPVVRVYDGREVRFCCGGCPPRFEKNLKAEMAEIDEAMKADQRPFYAMEVCPVGKHAPKGEEAWTEEVIGNRLVRFCCEGCIWKYEQTPEKYLPALDKAAADAQRPNYPLETCLVSGEKLDEAERPHEIVIASRLVRLCCEKCAEDVKADPQKHLARLDEAWRAEHPEMFPAPDAAE